MTQRFTVQCREMTTAMLSERNWPNGLNVKRHPNGQMKVRQFFVDGKRYGTKTRWNQYGVVLSTNTLFADQLHGEQEQFDDHGREVASYVAGKRWGVSKSYHWVSLVRQAEYRNDEMHGRCTCWWPDGRLESDRTMFNGQIHGYLVCYRADGRMRFEGCFHFGQRHGLSTDYGEDGKPLNSTEYRYGLKHGASKIYDQNGELKFTNNYFEDRPHGPCEIWSNNTATPLWFSHGKLIIDEQMTTIKRFLKRCKIYRLARLVKTAGFNEWFFSPDAPGGQLTVARLANSKHLI